MPAKPRRGIGALAGDERLQVHSRGEPLAGAGEDADAELVVGVELVERRRDSLGSAALTALRASGR